MEEAETARLARDKALSAQRESQVKSRRAPGIPVDIVHWKALRRLDLPSLRNVW